MTSPKREKPEGAPAPADSPPLAPRLAPARSGQAKARYQKPRLTDYGKVSKLTQTGGITTRDTGTRKRVCL